MKMREDFCAHSMPAKPHIILQYQESGLIQYISDFTKYKAYTLRLGKYPQSAITDIYVSHAIPEEAMMMPEDGVKCRGKWDTGCNMTCISRRIAEALKLVPERLMEVKTPHGASEYYNTYNIAIKIPNGHIYHNVEVCEARMVDADMLIGMDIITMGDFALSHNQYGEVILSICTPPLMSIDLAPLAYEVNKDNLTAD